MDVIRDHLSLSFSIAQATKAFPGSDVNALVLALLAGIQPQPDWEGAAVFQAPSNPGEVRLGLSGPAAQAIRDELAHSLTRVGIEILTREQHDDLEMKAPLTRVKSGAWC